MAKDKTAKAAKSKKNGMARDSKKKTPTTADLDVNMK